MTTPHIEKIGPEGIIKETKPLLGAFGTTSLLSALGALEVPVNSGQTVRFQDVVKSKSGLYIAYLAGTTHNGAGYENGVYLIALDDCYNSPYCGGTNTDTGSVNNNLFNGYVKQTAAKSTETTDMRIMVKQLWRSAQMCTGTCSYVDCTNDGAFTVGGAYPGAVLYVIHLAGGGGMSVTDWENI
jgi:hypothetical protein